MDPCTVDPGGLDPGKDLPLMANTTDILVKHFIVDLKVNFDERRFHGNIVLFCEPNIKGMKRSQPRVTCETTDVSGREDDSVMSKRRAAGISSGNHRNLRDEITGEDSGQGQGDRGDDSHQCQSQQERTKPKILDGELLQSKDDDYRNPFYFTLDCRDITIKRVEEIVLTSKETNDGCHTQEDINSTIDSGIVHHDNNIHTTNNIRDISDQVCGNHGNTDSHILEDILGFDGFDCKARNKAFWNCKELPGNSLHFSMDPWCVRIWKDGVHDVIDFPAIVRIHYHSNPEGTSVSWAHDQDNK
ncbi:aminopeptidase O-like [Glandiceps talaboti]